MIRKVIDRFIAFQNGYSWKTIRNYAIKGNSYLTLKHVHTFQGIFRLFFWCSSPQLSEVPTARPARLPGPACALPSYQSVFAGTLRMAVETAQRSSYLTIHWSSPSNSRRHSYTQNVAHQLADPPMYPPAHRLSERHLRRHTLIAAATAALAPAPLPRPSHTILLIFCSRIRLYSLQSAKSSFVKGQKLHLVTQNLFFGSLG